LNDGKTSGAFLGKTPFQSGSKRPVTLRNPRLPESEPKGFAVAVHIKSFVSAFEEKGIKYPVTRDDAIAPERKYSSLTSLKRGNRSPSVTLSLFHGCHPAP
jgi:hypothetical protein